MMPLLTTQPLDLGAMQASAIPAPPSEDAPPGALIWDGWLPLTVCRTVGPVTPAVAKAASSNAQLRISLLIEDALKPLLPVVAPIDELPIESCLSASMCASDEGEDHQHPIQKMQSFRLGVPSSDLEEGASHTSTWRPVGDTPSPNVSPNRTLAQLAASAASPAVAAPAVTVYASHGAVESSASHMAALEIENGQLRAELERAQSEAANLRRRHEEDRQRVQEKLQELEVEVRGRWQGRVAELETEVATLKSLLASTQTAAAASANAQHNASASAPIAHMRTTIGALPGPGSMCDAFRTAAEAQGSALVAPFDRMKWPELNDSGVTGPLLDGPRVSLPPGLKSPAGSPPSVAAVAGFQACMRASPVAAQLRISPPHGEQGGLATMLQQSQLGHSQPPVAGLGLLPPPGLRVSGLSPVPGLQRIDFGRTAAGALLGLAREAPSDPVGKATGVSNVEATRLAQDATPGRPPVAELSSSRPPSPPRLTEPQKLPGPAYHNSPSNHVEKLRLGPTVTSSTTVARSATGIAPPQQPAKPCRSRSAPCRRAAKAEGDDIGLLGFFEAFGGFYNQMIEGTKCTGPDTLAINERHVEIDLSSEFPPERRPAQVDLMQIPQGPGRRLMRM